MKKLLFINACVRGNKESRTYKIVEAYLNEINKNASFEVVERNIMQENLSYLSSNNFSEYIESTKENLNENRKYKLAREFACADWIVIAAPFWEFSFPAILSCYIENISIPGITFKYTENGSIGLCKAEKMVYIFSSGDILIDNDRVGEKLLYRLSQLYGIPHFETIVAQGLDLLGANEFEIINKSIIEAKNKAKHEFLL